MIEAMTLALKALLVCAPCHNEQGTVRQAADSAIAALRTAIEAAEKLEPVDFWALFDENQRLRAELKFNTAPPAAHQPAAAELRRLKAVNAQLLGALIVMVDNFGSMSSDDIRGLGDARAAIAAAKEQS